MIKNESTCHVQVLQQPDENLGTETLVLNMSKQRSAGKLEKKVTNYYYYRSKHSVLDFLAVCCVQLRQSKIITLIELICSTNILGWVP